MAWRTARSATGPAIPPAATPRSLPTAGAGAPRPRRPGREPPARQDPRAAPRPRVTGGRLLRARAVGPPVRELQAEAEAGPVPAADLRAAVRLPSDRV